MVHAAKAACVVLSKVLLEKWGGFVEEVRVQTRSVRWEFGVPARTQINRHVVRFFLGSAPVYIDLAVAR
jgi:hypothetical protein